MAKNAHLTYDERLTIQSSLADHLSFKAIGLIIGKDPSTISKEVKGHIKIVETNAYNPCVHSRTCKHNRDVCKPCSKKFSQNCRTCSEDCYKSCAEYVEGHCLTLLKPPYVCNGFDDFKEYTEANPDVPVVEMDSVEGRKGGKVFLTIYFRNCSLMLAFIRDHNTAKSVTDIFNGLYERLGHDVFVALFSIILTDRGSEFTNPLSIEFTADGKRRTRIFYCDPQRSDQKGGIEVTHEMIRRVLKKGTSFDNLTQDDVTLMMSHINSYKRKKLGNRSAHQLFSFLHGEEILEKLGITLIPSDEINLTPLLLKK